MNTKYDYLVIGSGPAGHTSAVRAAQLGLRAAVVEKDENMFGGVCLNEGCIPAKSLYHSAGIFDIIRKNRIKYGDRMDPVKADMSGFVKESREAVRRLRKGLAFLLKENGIDLIRGNARFIDKKTVSISGAGAGSSEIKAEKFLIATGSKPSSPAGVVCDGKYLITSSEGMRLSKVPKSMLIVGGGAIGVEFASFFQIMGTEVTVIEVCDTLLPSEDREVSRQLQSIFTRRGITVLTGTRVRNVAVDSGAAVVAINGKKGENTAKYEVILFAVGRQPVTSDMALEEIGVKKDEKGFVPVSNEMRTNVENIYAAGDVLRTPMLAHAAYTEGETAAESAAGNPVDPVDYSAIPNAVYSEVQVASVGMTEEQVKLEGLDAAVGKQFFRANGRAVVNNETDGFVKVIADKSTGKLLGAHIIGYGASELIHEFVVAKKAGLTANDIGKTVHAHPTFSETAAGACRAVSGEAVLG